MGIKMGISKKESSAGNKRIRMQVALKNKAVSTCFNKYEDRGQRMVSEVVG